MGPSLDPRLRKPTSDRPTSPSPTSQKGKNAAIAEPSTKNPGDKAEQEGQVDVAGPSKKASSPPPLEPFIKPRPRVALANMGQTMGPPPSPKPLAAHTGTSTVLKDSPVPKDSPVTSQPSTPKKSTHEEEPGTPQTIVWPSTPRSASSMSPSSLEQAYQKRKLDEPKSATVIAVEMIGAYELMIVQMAEQAENKSLEGMLKVLETARAMPKVDKMANCLNVPKSTVNKVYRELVDQLLSTLPQHIEESFGKLKIKNEAELAKKRKNEEAADSIFLEE